LSETLFVGSAGPGHWLSKKKTTGKKMQIEQVVISLIIGGVAGWLAGTLFKGRSFGLVGNIVIGLLGAVLGGWLFGVLNISIGGEWIGPIVTSTVGAIVLLYLIGLVKKK
jgi:uncharacterized membrane protein YeaQ/YmgE (transglycosylase-associated protein family)